MPVFSQFPCNRMKGKNSNGYLRKHYNPISIQNIVGDEWQFKCQKGLKYANATNNSKF